jgi:DNA-directed RNA polymerase
MPNLVHSLDASNIHLLCNSLNNEPLYTIHDCFATTANNMGNLEDKVKSAFINIYFTSGNYLEKLHISIIDQIRSYSPFVQNLDGSEYTTIEGKIYNIPNLPSAFIDPASSELFIKGIKNSKFFIS